MTTAGANPTGQKQDDIRTLFFGQDSINSNFNGANNPYGNIITSYFPGVQQFARARLSLTNLNLYNSWYNFTAARGNSTFSYSFPEGSSYAVHSITIPDGQYETIEEVNDHMQGQMIKNGDYLIYYDKEEGTQTFTYYINLETSTFAYAYQLTITPLPATILTGAITDASATGYYVPAGSNITTADENFAPLFIVPATSAPAGSSTPAQYSFSKSTGFSPGSYGSTNASPGVQVSLSNFAPQIQYTSIIYVACNLVNMGDTNRNPNVFFQFVPNAAFGELVVVVPPYPVFVPVADSFYSYIQISLFDENLNPLLMNDPQCYGAVIVQG